MSEPAPRDELTDLWRGVREQLEGSLQPSTFNLWVAPLKVVAARDETLLLTAAPAVRAWVERRYVGILEQALRASDCGLRRIAFVDPDPDPGDRRPAVPRSLPLDEAHNFERFVIGPGNRLAHAAALAVAESPGEAYNPLFLHGPPGLGKTHLLGAVAGYMARHHRELTVHITTAERFTSEFVGSLRRDGPEVFKARYRNLDALLIDDVQVLEGKERTEEEFVHTFNALYGAGKQIVLSSDRPPEALSRLAERLRDRLGWGLTVELERPDLRTRMALLWRFASAAGPELSNPGVLEEIAVRVPGNVRVLEGAMTRVLAVSSLLSEPVSLPLVRRALASDPPARPAPPAVTLEGIEAAVCSVSGLAQRELRSANRSPKVTRARQIVMYLTREMTALSLAEIARTYNRDHTTVMHAVRAVSGRLLPGSETERTIHTVRCALGENGDPPAGPGAPDASAGPPPQPHSS